MQALIIANGEVAQNQEVPGADMVIAADGGAAHALALGITPHLVIGDLDSLPQAARERLEAIGCEFQVHPQAKEKTDLELALEEAEKRGAKKILVLGALGSRPDQTLANFLFPTRFGAELEYQGEGWRAYLVRGSLVLEGKAGDTVSLLPITERARGVSTQGLLYALKDTTLERASTLGISNEMIADRAAVSIKDGLLWVIQLSKDHFGEGKA